MSIGFEDPNGFRVAELREVKVHGLPGIGTYTLVLNMHFMATPPKAETNVRNISVRLEWGDNTQRMIGVAVPDSSPIRITQYSTDIQVGFRLPLSAAQIEDIEKRRDGAGFKLALWLIAEVEQAGQSKSNYGMHEFAIRQQDWIEALESMDYRRTMLFELPVPSSDAPIGELVAKAQAFLHKGEYDQTVNLCRQAIEKIEELAGDKSAASRVVEKFRVDRKSMDLTERLLFLRESLKNATHLAAHHSSNHDGYSRDQAKAILGTTIALLGLSHSRMWLPPTDADS